MVTNIAEQSGVKEWFNKTYKKRGYSYLRPKEAYYIFLEILGTKPQGKLLDIACGPGQLLRVAAEYDLKISGVDISDVGIGMAQSLLPQADLKVANAEHLPFPANSFDYLTCIGSLERMLDLPKVLQEIRRVAKPQAEICFMVRNSNRISWKFIKETLGIINRQGHQGADTLANWSKVFTEAGYKIEAVYPDLWPSTRWLHWLSLGGRLFKANYKKLKKEDKYIDKAYEFIFHLRIA